MRTPLVSVVVPTHERAHYAVSTIRSLLELSDEIEVVVSDSSENDAISPAFAGVQASARLKILRPTKKLSVVDNFNFALRSAVGRYVCFIGDDDFVSSELVTIAKWADRHCVDAVKLTFPALYFWPDFRHRTAGGEFAGTLRISPFTSRIMLHDARQAARDALDNLGAGPLEMPRIYAGLISSHLIKKITEKHGELFGGVSPDVYSALLISMEAEQCVKVDFPVVIPGASGASTAGLSAQGRHVGGLRDNPHIRAFENLEWIPEYLSFIAFRRSGDSQYLKRPRNWISLRQLSDSADFISSAWCFKKAISPKSGVPSLVASGASLPAFRYYKSSRVRFGSSFGWSERLYEDSA